MFAKEDFDILPEHRKWDHAIELIPRAEPKSLKVYPLSPLEQAELDAVTNFIRPYLHQFLDDSHGLKASLKPLRRPFDRYQSRPISNQ